MLEMTFPLIPSTQPSHCYDTFNLVNQTVRLSKAYTTAFQIMKIIVDLNLCFSFISRLDVELNNLLLSHTLVILIKN